MSGHGGPRKGAGRPPLPADERRERRIPIRPTEAEGAELDAWAKRKGEPLASLVLAAALRAARR
jgi:uncharacterized protein (DUF1778 family)